MSHPRSEPASKPPHPSPKSSQTRSSSPRACRLHRGQPIMASNRALADPRKPPSAPAMAQRRPHMDARCPRDGPESAPGALQRGPWRAKLRAGEIMRMQLRHLGASWSTPCRQEAVLKPFWDPILKSFWGPVWVQNGIKKKLVFDSFWAPFWGPKCGSNRPKKLPRWPSNAQKSAKMSSKSLLHGSFCAPLKPYKNLIFYDGLGPPCCPRATRETPKSPRVATLSPQEATKRTA